MSWQLASTLLVVAALGAGAAWYERSRPSSRLVSLVAALAALAVAGRVVFAPVPNVQATTDVVLLSGYALGAGPGFAVGAAGALVSNFFLGQGPWTPWQMLGWGAIGAFGAALARAPGMSGLRRSPAPGALGRWSLALACALAGFAFGAWMDLFTLLTFAAERSPDTYLVVAAAGLPFNVAHAVGNLVLCLLLGPGFVRLLLRFRRRFEIRWGPAPAATGFVLIALVSGAVPDTSAAADRAGAAVRYLERAQNRDGGFGAAPGQASSQLVTGWVVIGLEAAGRSPLAVRRAGRTPIEYMRRNARQLSDTGELERTILALRGAGLSARRFAGRDLVRELLRRRRADGSIDGQVSMTAFGVLALRAAGRGRGSAPVRRAAEWLARQQNRDGGFSFSRRDGASDVDDTGSVVQALGAAGRRGSRAVKRALAYLRRAQNPDGGFGQFARTRSNSQSTAWAVQGLVAAGKDPARFHGTDSRRSPLRYLRSLQQGDGSFRYSRISTQTPVWVTAQALAAVRRRPLPVPPVRRKRPERSRARPPASNRRRSAEAVRGPSRPARPYSRSSETSVASLMSRIGPIRPVGEPGVASRSRDRGDPIPLWLVAGGVGVIFVSIAATMRVMIKRGAWLRR